MNSLVSISEKICSLDAKNVELTNQIKALQEQIEFNNKCKRELQNRPVILDLVNEKDLTLALHHDEKGYYKKALDKSLKYHQLFIVNDDLKKEKVISLASNKRILKSTLSVLISLIKADVAIKIEQKNETFYIKKTDNAKIGIFENKLDDLVILKSFFSVKQVLEYLNLV